ncbi:hypothetical protein PHISCL_03330 [Aspergillus sclerotialis]|uniref:Uncharacterized protein n=1 Tax=Aspergillus sclerotialis TaxID=2070753 RepID=A0A3A3A2R9_9EURO|nr:hypothetical protein PHISCL_03330 [Aspergillus sclerotialis]
MVSPDQFFTKPLLEYYPANSGEWFAVGAALLHGGDPQYPHFMVKMLSGVNGEDDKMTRGELLCIIRIMERLLGAVKFIGHLITPVLVLSFMGHRQARVLQAHYNGDELVIHKTQLFDFTKKKDNDALLLLSRWAASSAVGDTVSGNSKAFTR